MAIYNIPLSDLRVAPDTKGHAMKLRHLVFPFFLFSSFSVFAVEDSMTPEMDALFARLQSEGKPAEEIILELVNSGADLQLATAYAVSNAASIGLAVAYAETGVCLAQDKAMAEKVGQDAVDSSTEESRKAVQAKVVSIISGFDEGVCRALAEQRNNDSQAFASSPGATEGGAGAPGGGAPPAATDDDDVSVSE